MRRVLSCILIVLSQLCSAQVTGAFKSFEDGHVYFVLTNDGARDIQIAWTATHGDLLKRGNTVIPAKRSAFWGEETLEWSWATGDVFSTTSGTEHIGSWMYDTSSRVDPSGTTMMPPVGSLPSKNANQKGNTVRLYDLNGNYVDKGLLWLFNNEAFVQYHNVKYDIVSSHISQYKYRTEIEYQKDYLYIK